jgi:hypothetical protein
MPLTDGKFKVNVYYAGRLEPPLTPTLSQVERGSIGLEGSREGASGER